MAKNGVMKPEYHTRIRSALKSWLEAQEIDVPEAVVSSCNLQPLNPDFSTRFYYRVTIEHEGLLGSLIAMLYDELVSPRAEKAAGLADEDSFPEIAEQLQRHGLPVPEVYFEDRVGGILLLEDLGDYMLGELLRKYYNAQSGAAKDSIYSYFKDAIDISRQFHSVADMAEGEARRFFGRSYSPSVFKSEMENFQNYALSAEFSGESTLSIIETAQNWLAERLAEEEFHLNHRDFHAWNLPVDREGRLRIIDFQDAVMAPPLYDLISLLGDRGTDVMLGKELYLKVIRYFTGAETLSDEFRRRFSLTAMQRDFKTCGQFYRQAQRNDISAERRQQVAFWITTTEQRLGRSLAALADIDGSLPLGELRALFTQMPDFSAGLKEGPWY